MLSSHRLQLWATTWGTTWVAGSFLHAPLKYAGEEATALLGNVFAFLADQAGLAHLPIGRLRSGGTPLFEETLIDQALEEVLQTIDRATLALHLAPPLGIAPGA